jgi:hypothetical protein
MADMNALYTALKNADAAGDTEAATKLAAHIRSLQNPVPPLTADPTDGMSTFDKLAAGAGKAVTDAGRGIGQLFGRVSDQDIAESRRLDAPLENTTAGKIGNIAGNVAMLAPTAMIPGANTITGAGTIGAITGALTTPGTGTERATAALLQGGGGALGQAIPRVVGSMRAAAEPLTDAGRSKIIGRVMNKTVGDDTAAVVAKLRSAQPLLPGSAPTAAEVAESGGMAALQRAMSAADPEAYANRGMSQASARLDAIRGIAGDEGKKELYRSARSSAAKDLYERAFSVPIEPENLTPAMRGEVTKLMQMPAIQDALTTARTNAANHGMDVSKLDGSIAGLHQAKLAMDDKIAALSSGTANQQNAAKAIQSARDRLVTFMENMSPDYNDARVTYAAMSKPVNQMDVGQALLDKLKPALSDHGALAKETAASYAQALRNGDGIVKQATGRDLPFNKVMDPEQIQTLNAVAQDLARKSNAQDLGRGVGSNTFQNFAMDNLAQTMGVPSAVKSLAGVIPGLSPTATLLMKGAQGVGGLAYKNADEAIRRDMAQALLNPQAAARLMDNASQPALMARLLRKLPNGVQGQLPPEDILKLLQASPGLAGMATAPAALADTGQ